MQFHNRENTSFLGSENTKKKRKEVCTGSSYKRRAIFFCCGREDKKRGSVFRVGEKKKNSPHNIFFYE